MQAFKALKLAIYLFALVNLLLGAKKLHSVAAVVSDPVAHSILSKLDTNIWEQRLEMASQLQTLKYQLEQAQEMAKNLADGKITPDMVDFAFKQSEKCGFKAPSIPFPDFPSLSLPKLCSSTNSIEALKEQMASMFSYKHNMSVQERAKITANRRVLTKDSLEYGLALGSASRTLDTSDKKQDWAKQMKQSQSLVHQIHVNNSIAISIYSELVELRRINGALLELISIVYGSEDTTQYYNKQGELKKWSA